MNIPQKGFELSLKITGRTLTAVWLMLFYLFSIWMVLGTLSSHQFQSDIRKEAVKEGQSVYPVAIIKEILLLEDNLESLRLQITAGEDHILKIRTERDFLKVGYVEIHSKLDHATKELAANLKAAGAEEAAQDISLLAAEMLESFKALNSNVAKAVDHYNLMLEQAKAYNQTMIDADLKLEQAKSHLLEYRSRIDLLTARINSLAIDNDISPERINDLRYMRRVRVYFLALMPSQMLTLFLTMSMGGLGSIIYLTRTFIDFETNKSFSWYVFRTFLGMTTAIAMFILIKAGQIIVSDSNPFGHSSQNINPFFISFLAIISGILSEQAYEKIQQSGRAFFQVGAGEQNRWAFKLKPMLTQQDMTARDVARLTGTPLVQVEKWLDEKSTVPKKEQDLIAAYLRIDSRELFSDQAPRPI